MKNTKSYFFALCMWLAGVSAHAQGLVVNGAATVRLENGAYLVLNDSKLDNNGGTINTDVSTVIVMGTGTAAASAIGGTGTTGLYHLVLNKPANGFQLEGDVSVFHTFTVSSGKLNLNGHDLTLGTSSGNITGETESNYVFGTAGGEIIKVLDLNAPSNAQPGNLGISISSSSNLGSTTIKRGHAQQTSASGFGIYRYFSISPTNNTNLDATLVYTYLDAEVALAGITESELDLWRKPSGGDWTAQGATLNTTANTLTKTGISAFSDWTAGSTINDPLPVTLVFFNAACAENGAKLVWETASEFNSHHFSIEKSKDGLAWENMATMASSGTSKTLKHYEYYDFENRGTAYYRLSQTDIDGSVQHFQVVTASCQSANGWHVKVYPNPATQHINIEVLDSEGEETQYELLNINGIQLQAGQIPVGANQSLDLSLYPTGIYLVRFFNKGKVEVVKIEKQ